ncbi:ATP-dependent DNA helicase DDM1 [Sesamum angolense]|uniref:ATP-dependent DNA helicase DDM1 n=1 Tax=Sesamum angolense TaxID=2727404 RepID=A0AAE1XE77_9LAMI|nr:ATP-dependent DNA helicase DDM1 [Sesamum angolense]
MLTRTKDGDSAEDSTLTDEERAEKEQAELVPLLTGGKLKPYQIKGVKWMISLWQNGLNGILADQMGLGKTIQTIAFLAHLKGNGMHGPFLIIAPLSTLSNWMNEIQRFVPSVEAIIYHGSKKERDEIIRKHMPRTVAELWSLLNFILPDIFSSHEEFESWFDFSGKCANEGLREEMEEKRRAQVVAKLHAILRPFLLRRMKADVEQLLPRKKEISSYGMKGKLNNLMIQLRNCNHPDLLESAFDGSHYWLAVCSQAKVLIFSQWTKILDIMDYYFSEKGFEVCRIDGRVNLAERRRQIEEFNDVDSNYRIFLLSTRAGGLGINLTAADTCILYDSDWNPQMDLQAMDRCHRIGQTKPVHVYRLATAQSVEGRVLKRAFSKLKLEHVVIGKGQFKLERSKPEGTDIMTEEELLALLHDKDDEEDKWIQTDISDEDLERVLDRSDLVANLSEEDEKVESKRDVLPLKGPGWEVVIPTTTGGMLSTLSS